MSDEMRTMSLLGADLLASRRPPADEVTGVQPTVQERDGRRSMMVFAGRSTRSWRAGSPSELGIELGRRTIKTFPNGETYMRFDESVRGADVFLIQSCSAPVDRQPVRAAHHGERRQAGLGHADHRGHAVVSRTRARTRSRRRASRSPPASSQTCSRPPASTAC